MPVGLVFFSFINESYHIVLPCRVQIKLVLHSFNTSLVLVAKHSGRGLTETGGTPLPYSMFSRNGGWNERSISQNAQNALHFFRDTPPWSQYSHTSRFRLANISLFKVNERNLWNKSKVNNKNTRMMPLTSF